MPDKEIVMETDNALKVMPEEILHAVPEASMPPPPLKKTPVAMPVMHSNGE